MNKESRTTNADAMRHAARMAGAGIAVGIPIGLIPSLLAGWGRTPDPDEYDSDVGMLPGSSHPSWDELKQRVDDQEEARRKAVESVLGDKSSSTKEAQNGDGEDGDKEEGSSTIHDILASAAKFSALPIGLGVGVYTGNNLSDLYMSSRLNQEKENWKKKLRTAYIKEQLAQQLDEGSLRDPFNKYSETQDKVAQSDNGGGDGEEETRWKDYLTGAAGLAYGMPAVLTSILAYKYFAENDPERQKTKILKRRLSDLRQNQPHVDPHTDIDLTEDEQEEIDQFFNDISEYKE